MKIYELIVTHDNKSYQYFYTSYIKCNRAIDLIIEKSELILQYSKNALNNSFNSNKILIEQGELFEVSTDVKIYDIIINQLIVL